MVGRTYANLPVRNALDPAGDAYVAGIMNSRDFPTVHPAQARLPLDATNAPDQYSAFLARLTANGWRLTLGTYLGGSGTDTATAVASGATGHAYLAGDASSGNFPLMHPLEGANAGSTAFLALTRAG